MASWREKVKLIVSIVNLDDLYALTDALVEADHDATVISTTGGFLREGNATILIGAEDASVAQVLRIIRNKCRTRMRYMHPVSVALEGEESFLAQPIEVQVGGAVVFVLDVERFERF
jgi:uncharacterized protein YaaQ